MIVPSDSGYINTKFIKRGSERLDPVFQVLADWINLEFDALVLNIFYDKINTDKDRPRLNIIFEHEFERKRFFDNVGNFDSTKQEQIGNKFKEILSTKFPYKNFDTKRLLVIFSAFEPVARIEVAWKIQKKEIEKLKHDLRKYNVWEIYQEFEITTIFFYTDEQTKDYTNNGTTDLIKSKLFRILKKYDEFDYIKETTSFIEFDSKQKFDDYYKGNWFYYSRR
jgi:hypothetical protein